MIESQAKGNLPGMPISEINDLVLIGFVLTYSVHFRGKLTNRGLLIEIEASFKSLKKIFYFYFTEETARTQQ